MKEKKNEAAACAIKTSIGGQALMEGIMMRGPQVTAMAVRNTKGEIVVEESETKGIKRPKICRLPIIRGIFGYIDSMAVGYKALMRSAELSGLEDVVEESPRKKKKREAAEKAAREAAGETVETTVAETTAAEAAEAAPAEKSAEEEEKVPAWVFVLMMVVGMVLCVGIMLSVFIFVPTALYEWIAPHVPFFNTESLALNSLWKSAFEGIFKVLLLVGYMGAISLMKDIRRTFMFHGAEHKTIFCYEAGLELTVENVRKQRRFHPRCGTSFLVLMVLVSILISFLIDPISVLLIGKVLPPVLRSCVRILLIPLIVGIGYELIKFAGRHDNLLTRIISAPGVWLQHITVFEPTDDMIECAILAMERVIPKDQSDKW